MVLEVQGNRDTKRDYKINKIIREMSDFKTKLEISDLMVRLDKIEETLVENFNFMTNKQIKKMMRALSKVSYQITKKINIKLKTIKVESKRDFLHYIFRKNINTKNKLMKRYKIKTQ